MTWFFTDEQWEHVRKACSIARPWRWRMVNASAYRKNSPPDADAFPKEMRQWHKKKKVKRTPSKPKRHRGHP